MKNKLYRLLEDSLESYYWLGFILADGHITERRLRVVLSNKDEDHLIELANFLGTVVKYQKNGYPYIDISDKLVLKNLKHKFKIADNKSINPPDITSIVGNNLKALSIGFIDGDGNITKLNNRVDFQIRIKVHSSWVDVLTQMYGKCYINNAGYALTVLSNTTTEKELKLFGIRNNLPFLKRKWDIINLNYISVQEKFKTRLPIIVDLLANGVKRKDICKELNLSKSTLSQTIKRYKLI